MQDYFLLNESILYSDHAIALNVSRMFFNDFLINDTKFCVNQGSGFSSKFVCQNMCKFFKSSCFLWRYEIRSRFFQTHHLDFVNVCVKFCFHIIKKIILFWMKQSYGALFPPRYIGPADILDSKPINVTKLFVSVKNCKITIKLSSPE